MWHRHKQSQLGKTTTKGLAGAICRPCLLSLPVPYGGGVGKINPKIVRVSHDLWDITWLGDVKKNCFIINNRTETWSRWWFGLNRGETDSTVRVGLRQAALIWWYQSWSAGMWPLLSTRSLVLQVTRLAFLRRWDCLAEGKELIIAGWRRRLRPLNLHCHTTATVLLPSLASIFISGERHTVP